MKKFLSRILKQKKNKNYDYQKMNQEYSKLQKAGKKLVLCINVGRSGTRWLSDIFSAHDNAIGSCERHVVEESFYRYVKWNKLPIDVTGIIALTKQSILEDWEKHEISMVTSPYFSHDLLSIDNELKPFCIIWGVNNPRFTVTSFYNKGWYKDYPIRKDNKYVIGLQPNFGTSHSFGRVVPRGKEFDKWKNLTQVGKIAWFYNNVNLEIYSHIKKIPKSKIFIFKLEEADQNYEYYLQYANKLGLKDIISEKKFLSIKKESVRKSDNVINNWSKQEEKEFVSLTNSFYKIYKAL